MIALILGGGGDVDSNMGFFPVAFGFVEKILGGGQRNVESIVINKDEKEIWLGEVVLVVSNITATTEN